VEDGKRSILTEAEPPGAAALAAVLANLWVYDDVPGYLLKSIQAGGSLAREMLQGYIEITERMIADGARNGRMRLGADPHAQAAYAVLSMIGAMVAYCALTGNDLTTPEQVAQYVEDITLPALEANTYPLLTSDELLRSYIAAADAKPDKPSPKETP
jgi:hypothetical protein